MSAGHTRGPWVIEEGHIQSSGGIRYWQITDGQDAICCNALCYAGFVPMTNSANARLISAAPDLLEALELALKYWADRQQRYRNRAPIWVQEARAAIAKAKAKKALAE